VRILIRYGSTTRKFLVLNRSGRDGSQSLTIRREGVSSSQASWSTKSGEQEPTITEFEHPRPKDKRITIHQSGRVNYHEHGSSIFIAPLTQTTQAFSIYGYRVPALDKLDLHGESIADDDAVLDLTDLPEGPVSFSIILAPGDFVPHGRAIRLKYEAESYSIIVQVDPVAFAVPPDLDQHFTTFVPDRGLFAQQQMAEDQALICYHQALTGARDPILYTPNGEGTVRLIFSVPMRIAPRFRIELVDPELHVSELDVQRDGRSERVMLKYKVRHRKSGEVIRQPIEISSIELDAEL